MPLLVVDHRAEFAERGQQRATFEAVLGVPSLAGGSYQTQGLELAEMTNHLVRSDRGVRGDGFEGTRLGDQGRQDGDASFVGQSPKQRDDVHDPC